MTQMEKTGSRKCVACGYDLFGLGDEPRCPECGLLNIPDAFRREVWELVDSGRRFFSGFFTPFRKRPPGWWWALDREDDLRKSIRAAIRNAALAVAVIAATVVAADSLRAEVVYVWTLNYPDGSSDEISRFHLEYGWACSLHEVETSPPRTVVPKRGSVPRNSVTVRTKCSPPSGQTSVWAGLIALWAVLTWALPSGVGLWTQIRKGLPEFARAPRTILCASLYESHRLIYLGVFVAFASVLETAGRMMITAPAPNRMPGPLLIPAIIALASGVVLVLFAAAGWVGPVRSDFTRQLIRSRLHAVRVVIMYALVLPLLIVWAVAMLEVLVDR